MIKKYEFPTEAKALQKLNATREQQGFLSVPNAENAVDLGHISKVVGGTAEEPIIETDTHYAVDVMWFEAAPKELKKYEIVPNNPVHEFA